MPVPPPYYASMVCNFRIRFDEALHVTPGNASNSDNLPQPTEVGTVDSTTSTSLIAAGQAPSLVQGKADVLSQIVGIVPLRASVDLPGYRQAGRFSIDVLYRDFPIEPDLIRTIGVEMHLGTVSPAAWGIGNTDIAAPGSNSIGFGQSPRTSRVVTSGDEGIRNQLLFGLVDKIETTFDAKGFMVHMEGRDLVGLLLDLYVQPTMLSKLNVSQPINLVVQQIVNLVPMLQAVGGNKGDAVQVVTQANEWPNGVIPAPGVAGDWTKVNLGVGGGATPDGGSGTAGFLTCCAADRDHQQAEGVGRHHAAVRARRRRPVLRRQQAAHPPGSRALRSEQAGVQPAATDAIRTVPAAPASQGSVRTSIRVMSFGRDILSLKKSRKLAGFKVPTVRVVSVDTSSKQRGNAKIHRSAVAATRCRSSPSGVTAANATAAKRTSIAPSGAIAQTEPIVIPVPGIKSHARLLDAIAKSVYEEIGRGEVGGTCSTKDLASLGGDNSDPDLLYLRPGDPVRFTIDNRQLQSYPPPISDVAATYRTDPEKLAAELTAKLGDPTLGRVLAYALTGHIVERQSVYRVNHVRFTWDNKKGVAIDFDFQNYIEARAGITTKKTTKNKDKPVLAKGRA